MVSIKTYLSELLDLRTSLPNDTTGPALMYQQTDVQVVTTAAVFRP